MGSPATPLQPENTSGYAIARQSAFDISSLDRKLAYLLDGNPGHLVAQRRVVLVELHESMVKIARPLNA
jgi:hypothetical protein